MNPAPQKSFLHRLLLFYGVQIPNHPRKWWVHAKLRDLFGLLTRLNQEEGLSVLVIEQNARVALAHSTYGYVLETGRLAVEGTSEQLANDPHVQETYLGGGGEAKDAYEAVVERYAARGNG